MSFAANVMFLHLSTSSTYRKTLVSTTKPPPKEIALLFQRGLSQVQHRAKGVKHQSLDAVRDEQPLLLAEQRTAQSLSNWRSQSARRALPVALLAASWVA